MTRLISIRTLLIAGTALTGLTSAAHAQNADPVDAVIACRSIADPSARLACFDNSATDLADARIAGDLVTVSRADVVAVERDGFGFDLPSMPRISMSLFGSREPNALDPSAIAAATGDQPAAIPAPEPGSPAATRPAAPRPAPAAAPADEEVTIVRRDDDGSIEEISMVIERVREYNYNQHRFYMENGQVWRQLDTERVRLNRNSENTAVIRRATMGSYLMLINDRGTAIRVIREE
ncbi:MAG: hypothetical protein CMF74_08590 [Maricaulis sp.]|jgi:hypothetical protein|nr:hypothetical protein [Maricaulis sp.]HAQ35172.1 hypothetical protein [Alphaproteobacteria bacterium]